jgi:hypothetical protein
MNELQKQLLVKKLFKNGETIEKLMDERKRIIHKLNLVKDPQGILG